ncbi:MAG: hypothetical protein KME25_00570 [Symplocastrum torsivum CPER-KK1]|uniref:Uncharacterized protein n=1 Tax=Symplocastrum torsivum CPER-KK1 TaxID=450513 RepID=A0A951PI12_9CYAN|nr:hypothetical protein [Symplocastrum torsivum CPER-KK1]
MNLFQQLVEEERRSLKSVQPVKSNRNSDRLLIEFGDEGRLPLLTLAALI